jgi:MFS family permease
MGDTDPRDARGGRRRFSAAGRLDPPGPSLAATFTIGYTGFIVGPPLIGLLADREGLPKTLALLVMAALAVAVLGGRATATKPTTSSPDGDPPTVVPELEAAIH